MDTIKLDKNYNFLEGEKGLYEDQFIDAVDLIVKAESDKAITRAQASFLLRMVLKKEFKNQAKTILPFQKQQHEMSALFMKFKTKHIKHV
jgi:hypothetical protein